MGERKEWPRASICSSVSLCDGKRAAVPRRLFALILALTVAVAPMVLDKCAVGCEAPQAVNASRSTPTCHHETASGPDAGIGHVPVPCGHDHAATIATTAGKQHGQGRAFSPALLVVVGAAVDPLANDHRISISIDASPPGLLVSDLSLHLRI